MSATKATLTREKPKRKPRRDWRPVFLKGFAEGGTISAACEVANIARSTAYRERQANEDFALAWHDLEEALTDKLERKAVSLAMNGEVRLIEFLLKARRPDKYRDNVKVEHSGTVTFADLAARVDA